jgi:signal transduction histidine kinase
MDAGATGPVSKNEAVPWFRRLGGVFPHQDPRHVINAEIVAALNDVAGAVASARCVDDVLATIAERAKRITSAEKAAVVLIDETDESLDVGPVVVRGELARHVQDWWLQRLNELNAAIFESGEAIIERHDGDKAWLVCSPLRIREHPIGLLAVINSSSRPFTDLQVALLAILSAFAASSIESARLAEQGRSLVLEAERERIARELHDGLVQSLFSVSLWLEACRKQTLRDPKGVAARLGGIQTELTTAMGELRRFIYDLRPLDVRTLGLPGAINQWIRRVGDQTDAHGRLIVEGEPRPLSA